MKRIMYVMLLLSGISCLAKKEYPHEQLFARHIDQMWDGHVTYLLSYPRSGNTLTRYIIERITRRPTMGVRKRPAKFDSPLVFSFTELPTDITLKPVWKIHKSPHITRTPFYDPHKTKVILLVRNYKELAFRYEQYGKIDMFNHNGSLNEKNLIAALDHWSGDAASRELYFASLRLFDEIPDQNKLLIYYEDLVLNPDDVIYRLGEFFGCDEKVVQRMIAELDECRQRILSFYNVHQHSWSRGNDVRYYSKRKAYRQCVQIDKWVKQHYSDLWQRYLSIYDESNFRTS